MTSRADTLFRAELNTLAAPIFVVHFEGLSLKCLLTLFFWRKARREQEHASLDISPLRTPAKFNGKSLAECCRVVKVGLGLQELLTWEGSTFCVHKSNYFVAMPRHKLFGGMQKMQNPILTFPSKTQRLLASEVSTGEIRRGVAGLVIPGAGFTRAGSGYTRLAALRLHSPGQGAGRRGGEGEVGRVYHHSYTPSTTKSRSTATDLQIRSDLSAPDEVSAFVQLYAGNRRHLQKKNPQGHHLEIIAKTDHHQKARDLLVSSRPIQSHKSLVGW